MSITSSVEFHPMHIHRRSIDIVVTEQNKNSNDLTLTNHSHLKR